MKSKVIIIVSALLLVTSLRAEEFKVPEKTSAQKQDRVADICAENISMAIAFAKAHGTTVDEYAIFCGDRYAPQWNNEAGFDGCVTGMLGLWESFRSEGAPPIVILAQSESMIRFKVAIDYKRSFKDGPLYGTSFEEFTHWIDITHGRIAAYLGCTHTMQVVVDDFLIITITKK